MITRGMPKCVEVDEKRGRRKEWHAIGVLKPFACCII